MDGCGFQVVENWELMRVIMVFQFGKGRSRRQKTKYVLHTPIKKTGKHEDRKKANWINMYDILHTLVIHLFAWIRLDTNRQVWDVVGGSSGAGISGFCMNSMPATTMPQLALYNTPYQTSIFGSHR